MKERTMRTSQGWRRAKRRKYRLVRNVPPIVNDPECCARTGTIQLRAAIDRDDASPTLAKCLRPRAVAAYDENMVDEGLTGQGRDPVLDSERGGLEPIGAAPGADAHS